MITLDLSHVEQAATAWLFAAALAVAAVAYFCGCFNGAVIVSKYILRDDVRNHGSGNAGLTNFFRTFGGGLTLVVILLDVVKAIVAVLVGLLAIKALVLPLSGGGFLAFLPGDPAILLALGKYWAGLFCLLGHMFPCMFDFKGGKGILSGGTIAIMIDWRLAVLVWAGFLVLTILTRYVSLGSVYAAVAFPFGTWFFVSRDPAVMVLAVVLGGLIVWKHKENIKRLLKGEENKLSLHKKKEGGQ